MCGKLQGLEKKKICLSTFENDILTGYYKAKGKMICMKVL